MKTTVKNTTKVSLTASDEILITDLVKQELNEDIENATNDVVTHFTERGYSEDEISLSLNISIQQIHSTRLEYSVSLIGSTDVEMEKRPGHHYTNSLYYTSPDFSKKRNAAGKKLAEIYQRTIADEKAAEEKVRNFAEENGYLITDSCKNLSLQYEGKSYGFYDNWNKSWIQVADKLEAIQVAAIKKISELKEEAELPAKIQAWVEQYGSELAKLRMKHGFAYVELVGEEHARQVINESGLLSGFDIQTGDEWETISNPGLETLKEFDRISDHPLICKVIAETDENDTEYVSAKLNVVTGCAVWITKAIA